MKSAVWPLCQRSAHYLGLSHSLPEFDPAESWRGILFWVSEQQHIKKQKKQITVQFQQQSKKQIWTSKENNLFWRFLHYKSDSITVWLGIHPSNCDRVITVQTIYYA